MRRSIAGTRCGVYKRLRTDYRCHRYFTCATTSASNAEPILPQSAVPQSPQRKRQNFFDLSFTDLEETLADLGTQRWRALPIFTSIYKHGVHSFDQITAINRVLRDELTQRFHLPIHAAATQHIAADGTHKWAIGVGARPDVQQVETVFIPMQQVTAAHNARAAIEERSILRDSRGAVCFSSQVGCSLSCAFCHTGTMDKRAFLNLTSGEIVTQIMTAKHALKDFERTYRLVDTLVAMGMGEPLYNWRNLSGALSMLMDNRGPGFGKGSITVSTSGVVPGIDRLRRVGCRLAISLHASNDALRNELVPINKTFNIAELMAACVRFQTADLNGDNDGVRVGRRRIMFEYVMLHNVNDSVKDARALVTLLRASRIECIVNLIPFNKWPGAPFTCSSRNTIMRFADEIGTYGQLPVTIRWPKGDDIMAACGQLAITNIAKDFKPSVSRVLDSQSAPQFTVL